MYNDEGVKSKTSREKEQLYLEEERSRVKEFLEHVERELDIPFHEVSEFEATMRLIEDRCEREGEGFSTTKALFNRGSSIRRDLNNQIHKIKVAMLDLDIIGLFNY